MRQVKSCSCKHKFQHPRILTQLGLWYVDTLIFNHELNNITPEGPAPLTSPFSSSNMSNNIPTMSVMVPREASRLTAKSKKKPSQGEVCLWTGLTKPLLLVLSSGKWQQRYTTRQSGEFIFDASPASLCSLHICVCPSTEWPTWLCMAPYGSPFWSY